MLIISIEGADFGSLVLGLLSFHFLEHIFRFTSYAHKKIMVLMYTLDQRSIVSIIYRVVSITIIYAPATRPLLVSKIPGAWFDLA